MESAPEFETSKLPGDAEADPKKAAFEKMKAILRGEIPDDSHEEVNRMVQEDARPSQPVGKQKKKVVPAKQEHWLNRWQSEKEN